MAYAALLLFLTRIVEPIHGTRELIKFLVFTVVLTSFFTVAVRPQTHAVLHSCSLRMLQLVLQRRTRRLLYAVETVACFVPG